MDTRMSRGEGEREREVDLMSMRVYAHGFSIERPPPPLKKTRINLSSQEGPHLIGVILLTLLRTTAMADFRQGLRLRVLTHHPSSWGSLSHTSDKLVR